MFYKIDNKYYVKMRNYYKELDIIGQNLVPSKKRDSIVINDASILATPISYEEIIKEKEYVVEEVSLRHKKRK